MDREPEDNRWAQRQTRVVIGMDPHKRSVTIEVMAGDETVHGGGRFATDRAGYQALLRYARHVAGPGLGDRGVQRDRAPRGDASARR